MTRSTFLCAVMLAAFTAALSMGAAAHERSAEAVFDGSDNPLLRSAGPQLAQVQGTEPRGTAPAAPGSAPRAAAAPGNLATSLVADIRPDAPTDQELQRISPAGAYLAGRVASADRETAAAAAYWRQALRGDPRNPELIESAFLALLQAGDVEEAARLADRLVAIDREHRLARLVLGVRALKQRQFVVARQNLAQSVRGPIAELIAATLSAWAHYGAGEVREAVATIDKLSGQDWYPVFKELHAGLVLDAAGQRRDALKRFETAHAADRTALRVVEAYGRALTRSGRRDTALEVLRAYDKLVPRHPMIENAIEDATAGRDRGALVRNVTQGAAEVLYGIGASLGRNGSEELALVYLQLALYLDPQQGLALIALGDLYESLKRPKLAIAAYQRVALGSSLRRSAEVQIATNLDTLERTADARRLLDDLIKRKADDHEALMALGHILRGRKAFAECAEVYGRAIALVREPQRRDWSTFYFRGICHERNKVWALAEPDMKRALELYPDQPQVLNYLGYSWIDQGRNLEEGMRMVRRAVEQRPEDGYIVDSLGWAYFRVGKFEEAVKHLERAVELKPEDPVINDHLGDAYWMVGRQNEARFQWMHARDLKPEPEDLAKIVEKLRSGLPPPVLPASMQTPAVPAAPSPPAPAATIEPKPPGGGG